MTEIIELAEPLDLCATLAPVRHGRGDPTMRLAADGVWRATRTPEGAGTIHLRPGEDRRIVHARAWGPGASWLLAHAAALCGAFDSLDGFDPSSHHVVARLARARPDVRLCRTSRVFDALVPAVLEQKVVGFEARRAWTGLVRRFGEPAPGPAGLMVAPSPERVATVTSATWHRLGVERRRAETIRRAATVAARLEEPVDPAALHARLVAIPGIGAWTAAEVTRVALGDADAVSVGDYHLPHLVAWALAGEPRGGDDRMLELLAPFAGHRARVVRLVELGSRLPPRFGPRMPLRAIARH